MSISRQMKSLFVEFQSKQKPDGGVMPICSKFNENNALRLVLLFKLTNLHSVKRCFIQKMKHSRVLKQAQVRVKIFDMAIHRNDEMWVKNLPIPGKCWHRLHANDLSIFLLITGPKCLWLLAVVVVSWSSEYDCKKGLRVAFMLIRLCATFSK